MSHSKFLRAAAGIYITPPPWGGKRKRAGRKPTGRKGYLLRMNPSAMRGIKSAARAAGQTVPEYLDATYAL